MSEFNLDARINDKCKNLSGGTIGLTETECFKPHIEHESNILEQDEGTISSELRDISLKRNEIGLGERKKTLIEANCLTGIFEFFAPFVFSIVGMYFLFNFLNNLNS